MLSRIKGFVSRHWRKVAVAGVAIEGAYLLLRYAEKKIQEQHLRQVQEAMEHTRCTQHFESTERTCDGAITSLFLPMRDAINKALDCDSLTILLKNRPPNKVEIWEDLKILAFSRATAFVYCGAMLTTLLRTQLGIISGELYRTSVLKPGKTEPESSRNVHKAYLSSCQYFFTTGIAQVCELIRSEVTHAVGAIPLKQHLTLQDLDQVFWGIQTRMNNIPADTSPIHASAQYLFGADPPASEIDNLILNTVDVLESDETKSLIMSTASRGFSHMMDVLADYFADSAEAQPVSNPVPSNVTVATIESPCESKGKPVSPGSSSDKQLNCGVNTVDSMWVNTVYKDGSGLGRDGFVNPNRVSIPLAKLIPVVSGLIHTAGNSWMNHLVILDSLKAFGANIYEAFSQDDD